MSAPEAATGQDRSNARKRALVLDTGAIIGGSDFLFALGGLITGDGAAVELCSAGELVQFVTIPEVPLEVRNSRARERLALLRDSLVQRVPSSEALEAVIQFSKATGDYSALSRVDLRVLALAWMLEKETNGHKYLKKEPVVPEFLIAKGVPIQESLREIEEQARLDKEDRERNVTESDGWTKVQSRKKGRPKMSAKQTKRNEGNDAQSCQQTVADAKQPPTSSKTMSGNALEKKPISFVSHPENCKTAQDSRGDSEMSHKSESHPSSNLANSLPAENADNAVTHPEFPAAARVNGYTPYQEVRQDEIREFDDDGVGWINHSNLDEHLIHDSCAKQISTLGHDRVGCVTTDFAMQNVLVQMGITVISVDGRKVIETIRHYVLRCQSCTEISRELDRKFCGRCGNATLTRVTYKVNKSGMAQIFLSKKFHPRLRGTRYPIPMPRGGRKNNDLILCEDQINWGRVNRVEKQRQRFDVDVLDPDAVYNFGAQYSRHKPVVVGYGSRNPNEVRSKSKKKK